MKKRQRYNKGNDFRVAISGTVGAGKSTLVENLGKSYEDALVFKEMIDNELLELFYLSVKEGDSEKIELLNQFNFLSETIKRDIKSYYYDSPIKIYDRSIVEHIQVFAKMNLSYEQFFKYDFFQNTFLEALDHKGYDLGILLVVDEDENINRIKTRGRGSEQICDVEYFKNLNKIYHSEEFLHEFEEYNNKTVIINTTNLKAEETLELVKQIIDKEMNESN